LLPKFITVAVHGDLVPTNVLTDPESYNDILIDPRGDVLWSNGEPLWDPLYDAAKMKFYLYGWWPISSGAMRLRRFDSLSSSLRFETGLSHSESREGERHFDNLICLNSIMSPLYGMDRDAYSNRILFAEACHLLADSSSRLACDKFNEGLIEFILGVRLLNITLSRL
jgi:hypothetical protein